MKRCELCGGRIAGEGRVLRVPAGDGGMRNAVVCVWRYGSPVVEAMRARSKAQAAMLRAIASTPQGGCRASRCLSPAWTFAFGELL